MEYFKIGRIVATYGVDGRIVIKHSLGKESDFKNISALFLEENPDSFLPWFILSAKPVNAEETRLLLDGIISKEAARRLIQKEVWLEESDFNRLAATSAPISLLGFEIFENGKSLGMISEVIEQPHQILCKIFIREKEAWIPLHEKTLIKTDNKKKQVIVSLPDGLIEVFLNS